MTDLDVVGIGSMVVDRMHRAPRAIGAGEKALLRDLGDGPVQTRIGGVVLNHLGWAAALGLRTGIFGFGADDANGRFLRAAMERLGIAHSIELAGSASSVSEVFVDDAGERTIYMAPGATSETTPERVRAHAAFVGRARRLTTEVSQLPLAAARTALELARAAGAATVVDLDLPPSDALAAGLGDEAALDAVLRGADLLKPAKSACRELVSGTGDPLELARALRARYGNRAVVVTDGEAGCAIAADDFEGFVRARPVKASTRRAPATPSWAVCSPRSRPSSAGRRPRGSATRAAPRAWSSSAHSPRTRRARARACSSSIPVRRARCARRSGTTLRHRPPRRSRASAWRSRSSSGCAAGSTPRLTRPRSCCSRTRAQTAAACT